MESEPESIEDVAEDRKVPEELLQRLHDANERFHQAKQAMEQIASDMEFDHQRRIDQASEQMRIAERDVEEASLKIHGSLKPTPPRASNNH